MTNLKIRQIPFDFSGDIPFQWQPENPDFGMLCNAIAVLAIAFEKFVVASLKRAMPQITDPEIAEEADAFLRQEAQHARVHRAHMRALVAKYPDLQGVVDEAVASFDELLETKSTAYHLAYTADLEAMFTPTFKVMLDHADVLFRPGDDRVASMFIWHFVEEVEHRSSALLIYRHVVDDEGYRLRMLSSIGDHVLSVMKRTLEGFDAAVPREDRVVDGASVVPGKSWRREVGHRLPFVGAKLGGDTATALSPAGSVELLQMLARLVKAQIPGHDPGAVPTPNLADEWFARYDAGDDVTRWFTSASSLVSEAN